MITISNMTEVQGDMAKWLVAVKDQAEKCQKGLTAFSFLYMVRTGPQWSGDYVANLRLSKGAPDSTFTPGAVHPEASTPYHFRSIKYPYGEGSREAIGYAKRNAAAVFSSIKLGDLVFISSSAEHDQTYGPLIEGNVLNFRSANPSRGAVMARTARQVKLAYSKISESQAQALGFFNLGSAG